MNNRGLPRQLKSPCWTGGMPGSVQEAFNEALNNKSVVRAYNTFEVVGTTPTILLFEKADRNYVLIQNKGPGVIWISFGDAPQGIAGSYPAAIELQPITGFYEPYIVPVDTIYVVANAANTIVTAVQGVWSAT